MKEFILYCDEGEKKGKKFSNFYGGLLVHSGKIEEINSRLNEAKKKLFVNDGELKGTKITDNYADKYSDFLKEVFTMMREDLFKIRIMFTDNRKPAPIILKPKEDLVYFKLYYQFIKHAFGFRYIEPHENQILLRIFLDKLPDQSDRKNEFKAYLQRLLDTKIFTESALRIESEHIAEICSKKHILAQALDIVLHLIEFRLNEKNLVKEGEIRRSKRCRSKIKVYKYMISQIQTLQPNFNIGITTGKKGDIKNYWNDSYRHWIFESNAS